MEAVKQTTTGHKEIREQRHEFWKYFKHLDIRCECVTFKDSLIALQAAVANDEIVLSSDQVASLIHIVSSYFDEVDRKCKMGWRQMMEYCKKRFRTPESGMYLETVDPQDRLRDLQEEASRLYTELGEAISVMKENQRELRGVRPAEEIAVC